MKTPFYFIVLMALASIASGCNKGEAFLNLVSPQPEKTSDQAEKAADQLGDPDEPEITTLDFLLDDRQGPFDFLFEVDVDWTASVAYDGDLTGWLEIGPASGRAGASRLNISATNNTDPDFRRAFVDIAYGNRVLRLCIMQFGTVFEMKSKLEMHTDTSVLTNLNAHESYEEKISFIVNTDWEVTVEYKTEDTGWLTVSPLSGTAGKVELTVTVPENPSSVREASIRIVYGEESVFDYRWRPEHTIGVHQSDLNLARIFEPELTLLLKERGYIADERHISPEEVKQIKTLNLMGNWSYPEQRYLGKLTSLRGIEYFESLEYLSCWGNRLTSLDVSRNKALQELWCYSNELTSLDVSGCSELSVLYCHSNPIEALDVSGNPALTSLNCYNLQLSSLDVTSNPALLMLSMDKNHVSTLDVSRNPVLRMLDCSGNRLTQIDIRNNPDLRQFKCDRNPGDGKVFPIRSWFDLASMPTGIHVHFTTDEWSYEGRTIAPEYEKIN